MLRCLSRRSAHSSFVKMRQSQIAARPNRRKCAPCVRSWPIMCPASRHQRRNLFFIPLFFLFSPPPKKRIAHEPLPPPLLCGGPAPTPFFSRTCAHFSSWTASICSRAFCKPLAVLMNSFVDPNRNKIAFIPPSRNGECRCGPADLRLPVESLREKTLRGGNPCISHHYRGKCQFVKRDRQTAFRTLCANSVPSTSAHPKQTHAWKESDAYSPPATRCAREVKTTPNQPAEQSLFPRLRLISARDSVRGEISLGQASHNFARFAASSIPPCPHQPPESLFADALRRF